MIEYVSPRPCVFTNANFNLPADWLPLTNMQILEKSICELGVPIANICLLDSESTDLLKPEDAQKFSHFLFGGILGNSNPSYSPTL